MGEITAIDDRSSSEEEVLETTSAAADGAVAPADGASKPKKKKNKKKKKAAKSDGGDREAEQTIEPVQAVSTKSNTPSASVRNLEELLRQLAMPQDKPRQKAMDEYKFWRTQPVTKFDEKIDDEGSIDPEKTPDDVPDQPYPLLKEFEWCTLDLNDTAQVEEIYDLLYHNYVEDADETFRFKYSPRFFDWALKAPDCRPEWFVGVRVAATKKLVAFISGIPMHLRIRNTTLPASEVNFLCVHKKLRSKRLAPLLIKEITRRINKQNIWHALYTGGVVLPSPVSTCRYYHRSINWAKLNDVGFSPLPPNTTRAKMISKFKLPAQTSLPGLRLMERGDIDQVFDLLVTYLSKFELAQVFEKDELLHWLMHDYGLDGRANDAKDPDRVIWAYVVETPNGAITDMVSFYKLPSTVLGNAKHDSLEIAYAFYYASSVALDAPSRSDEAGTAKLKARLTELFNDALIISRDLGFDVFNALTLLDNPLFLEELKFGAGDGYLNYYVFNYKAFPIAGGMTPDRSLDVANRSGVAAVML
ncbi:glycylpeptide N-tetradecanoyltransferase-like protein [Myxozyma melibiosi]|uniref:Glycylpeptide N-tetradecanoyltransferase n=1 Tax=Myxozyma melibiosi TaxID=54550 RepID=A0ABR1F4H4_9ASCO